MLLLIIIPILVSGFIACNSHPKHFYKLHRLDGQCLYLKSAQLGTVSVILFLAVALLCNKYLPPYIDLIKILESLLTAVVADESDRTLTAWILLVTVGSILFSYLGSWRYSIKLLNQGIRMKGHEGTLSFIERIKLVIRCLIYGADGCQYMAVSCIVLMRKIFKDSPYDELLIEAYLAQTPVQINLETREVYVGFIARLGEPNESDGVSQEIAIIPLLGGYMHKDTLEVDYAAYPTALEDAKKGIPHKRVIMQDAITSVSRFDLNGLEEFDDEPIEIEQSNSLLS